jgi:nicotinamide mononucleotide (NMN) deamidase PncC
MLIGRVGQERNVARALDGFGQHALMRCAGSTDTTRQDFPAFRNEALKELHVLVINEVNLFSTEAADFAAMHAAASASTPSSIATTVAVTITSPAAALAVVKTAIPII